MKRLLKLSLPLLLAAASSVTAALTALPVKVMVQSGLPAEIVPLYKGIDNSCTEIVPATVLAPVHGTVTVIPARSWHWHISGDSTYSIGSPARDTTVKKWRKVPVAWLRYVPAAGFTGVDSFTYTVNGGTGASDAATCVVRVHPQEPGNMTALLIVNGNIQSAVATEVNRLKADMEASGYRVKIKSYPNALIGADMFAETAGRKLWDTLRAEYDDPSQTVAGAILIGRLPTFRVGNMSCDEAFWNMSVWLGDYLRDSMHFATRDTMFYHSGYGKNIPDNGGYTDFDRNYNLNGVVRRGLIGNGLRHIWVARMFGQNNFGTNNLAFGDEATLLKRMLNANHDYRSGASRLPNRAGFYNDPSKIGSKYLVADRLLELWPSFRIVPVPLSQADLLKPYANEGGAIWDMNSHGNVDRISTAAQSPAGSYHHVRSDTVMNHPFQFRFATLSACHISDVGQVLNRHFYTRGGGAVFGLGSTNYVANSGYHNLANTLAPNTLLRDRLKAGDPWGRAWINSGMGLVTHVFYGDPSLKASSPWPSNELPVLGNVTASSLGSGRMRITVQASDPDAGDSVALYEYWINRKYALGSGVPDTAGSRLGVLDFRFDSVSTVRVEVVDRFMARVMCEFTVVPDSGIRVVRNPGSAPEQARVRAVATPFSIAPSPFNLSATVRYGLEKAGPVEIRVLDLRGRTVALLKRGPEAAGSHVVRWDARNESGRSVGAGVYIIDLRISGNRVLRQITHLK